MANNYPRGALCITDFLSDSSGANLADIIQRVIDENPNRTIYFPDGMKISADAYFDNIWVLGKVIKNYV